jgi:hypothetical protein
MICIMHANCKCVPLNLFLHFYIRHTYNTSGVKHICAFDEKLQNKTQWTLIPISLTKTAVNMDDGNINALGTTLIQSNLTHTII